MKNIFTFTDKENGFKIKVIPLGKGKTQVISRFSDDSSKNKFLDSIKEHSQEIHYEVIRKKDLDYHQVTYDKETKKYIVPYLFKTNMMSKYFRGLLKLSKDDYYEHLLSEHDFLVLFEYFNTKYRKKSVDPLQHPLCLIGQSCEKKSEFEHALLCYSSISNLSISRGYQVSLLQKIENKSMSAITDLFIALGRFIQMNETSGLILLSRVIDNYQLCDFYDYYWTQYGLAACFQLAMNANKLPGNKFVEDQFKLLATLCFEKSRLEEAILCSSLIKVDKPRMCFRSFNAIVRESREYLVYGLRDCKYSEITNLVNAYDFGSFPYQPFQKDESSQEKECQSAICRLIVENYERILQGKMIIPLLFCINYLDVQTPDKNYSLQVDELWKEKERSITERELRRIYRIMTEMPDDIREIANKTIKFIDVSFDANVFLLNESQSFCTAEAFKENWTLRAHSKNYTPSIRSWRHELIQEMWTVKSRDKLEKMGLSNEDDLVRYLKETGTKTPEPQSRKINFVTQVINPEATHFIDLLEQFSKSIKKFLNGRTFVIEYISFEDKSGLIIKCTKTSIYELEYYRTKEMNIVLPIDKDTLQTLIKQLEKSPPLPPCVSKPALSLSSNPYLFSNANKRSSVKTEDNLAIQLQELEELQRRYGMS